MRIHDEVDGRVVRALKAVAAALGNRHGEIWIGAGLLAAFLAQSVASMRLLSATHDEPMHLTAGYTYLETGSFRLNPQHPPLAKILAALPLLALDPVLDLRDPGWTSEPPEERGFGQRFLYSNDADRLLFWGRLPLAILATLLGFYVWRWARALFGVPAGLCALFLFALCPNLVGHSHLVTFDVPLAAFFVMTLYHAWRWVRTRARFQLAAAGICLGLALGTKFSAVVLVPTLAMLFSLPDRTGGLRIGRAVWVTAIVTGVAFVVVHAIYIFPSDPLLYFRNATRVYADKNPLFEYYLLGDFRKDGWWYYFLVAMLFKTPLPALLVAGASVAAWRSFRTADWRDDAFLVVPALAFGIVTSALAHNIGLRYMLPVYPLLFVFASRLAPALRGSHLRGAIGVALAAWYVVSAVRIYPDHLSYFNELCGGPSRGYEVLDDSNIDWGQDLERLSGWLRERNVPEVYLGYFGMASPEHHGIRSRPVADSDLRDGPRPGVYAMSVHMLIRGRLWARREGWRSDWLDRYEPIGRVGHSILIYRFE